MDFKKTAKYVFDQVSETNLPSATIAVVNDKEIIWKRAVGYRQVQNGIPATTDSLYCIGSVTKSFTALALLKLQEEGKLSIQDPIEKYLDFDIKPFGEKIKIWHFLSHTSGLPALAYAENVIRKALGDDVDWFSIASTEDMLSFMEGSEEWALAKPGERWFYLNEGYELLGGVIEKVSDMPYNEYVEKEILEPLGMTKSGFSKAKMEAFSEFATPYIATPDGKLVPGTYPYGSVAAAGGLISSVEEMAEVVKMYLNWGKTDKGQLLTKESLEDMQTGRIITPREELPFGSYEYALGLGVMDDFYGKKLVSHSGSVGSATAYMGFIPEENIGVVVLLNGSGASPIDMGMYAMVEAMGKDPEQMPHVEKARIMKQLTGNYVTFKNTTKFQVKQMGDFLMLVSLSKFGASTPLIPLDLKNGKRLFYTLGGGAKVKAEFLIDGDQITLVQERYAYRKTGELL